MSNASDPVDNDYDDEILDIFVEEATEVLEKLAGDLPRWRTEPDNQPLLTDIRRAFHTLKGSGRMANALDIAEIAWKVEQALNKALDGSLRITPGLIDTIVYARDTIPAMVQALNARQPSPFSESQLSHLGAQVDAAARGETVVLVSLMADDTPVPVSAAHAPAEPAVNTPTTMAPAVAQVTVTPASDTPPTDLAAMNADLVQVRKMLTALTARVDSLGHGLESVAVHSRDLDGRILRMETSPSSTPSQRQLDEIKVKIQGVTTHLQDLNELRATVTATQERVLQQQKDARGALGKRMTEEVATLMKRNTELKDQVQHLQGQLQNVRRWTVSAIAIGVGAALVVSWGAFYFLR